MARTAWPRLVLEASEQEPCSCHACFAALVPNWCGAYAAVGSPHSSRAMSMRLPGQQHTHSPPDARQAAYLGAPPGSRPGSRSLSRPTSRSQTCRAQPGSSDAGTRHHRSVAAFPVPSMDPESHPRARLLVRQASAGVHGRSGPPGARVPPHSTLTLAALQDRGACRSQTNRKAPILGPSELPAPACQILCSGDAACRQLWPLAHSCCAPCVAGGPWTITAQPLLRGHSPRRRLHGTGACAGWGRALPSTCATRCTRPPRWAP